MQQQYHWIQLKYQRQFWDKNYDSRKVSDGKINFFVDDNLMVIHHTVL